MQYNQLVGHIINLKKIVPSILKAAVFCFSAITIFYLLDEKNVSSAGFIGEALRVFSAFPAIMVLSIVLMFVNWGIEAAKWQFLVQKFSDINFVSALKGVFSGVALGFVTPHGIGDYFGRILQLDIRKRKRFVGAILLSRLLQLYITLIFGSSGLVFFIYKAVKPDGYLLTIIACITGITVVFSLLLLLFYRQIIGGVKDLPVIRKIYQYLEIIGRYDNNEVGRVFLYSFFRYLVFTLQFIILLKIFNVSTDYLSLFMGANFVFLAKSVIPTLFDLGVREYSAVYFFGLLSVPANAVLHASLFLWVVNLVIPALFGSFLFFSMKIFPGR